MLRSVQKVNGKIMSPYIKKLEELGFKEIKDDKGMYSNRYRRTNQKRFSGLDVDIQDHTNTPWVIIYGGNLNSYHDKVCYRGLLQDPSELELITDMLERRKKYTYTLKMGESTPVHPVLKRHLFKLYGNAQMSIEKTYHLKTSRIITRQELEKIIEGSVDVTIADGNEFSTTSVPVQGGFNFSLK